MVDGLDEDRGSDTHSIAALLPEDPEPGMRIIVAGRPHPPIPEDVSDHHPLRDPAVVRVLDRSPQAAVERRGAERALKRLLGGDDRDKALLGLVVAAGGGLSAADLAQLISPSGDVQPWEVADHLRTVAGRAFSSRLSTDGGDPESALYILAHEELQVGAVKFLGPKRLGELRDQVCRWADSQDWSADTPDYLVRGYFRLLQAIDDLPRMVALATDLNRQNWLRDRTGGDAVALSQIASCRETVLDADEPDLLTAVCLAMHHDRLTERNRHVPGDLPGIFAKLGRLARADALARCLTDRTQRDVALLTVARAALAADDVERAVDLVAAIEDTYFRDSGLIELSTAKARRAGAPVARATEEVMTFSGVRARRAARPRPPDRSDTPEDLDERLASANAIADRRQRSSALYELVRLALRLGEFDGAIAIVAMCEDRVYRKVGRQVVVSALVGKGELDRAEELARTADCTSDQVELLAMVARRAVESDARRTAAIASRVESLARSDDDPVTRSSALAEAVRMFVAAGEFGRAEALLSDITIAESRVSALVAIMQGDSSRASEFIEAATSALELITNGFWRDRASVQLCEGLAAVGRLRLAADVAHKIGEAYEKKKAFRAVVAAALATGDIPTATGYANEIEDVSARADLVTDVAVRCVKSGRMEDAERLAENALRLAGSVTDSGAAYDRIATLVGEIALFAESDLVVALEERLSATAGFWHASAVTVLSWHLEAKSRRLEPRDQAMVDKDDVARAVAHDTGRAALLAAAILNPFDRASALTTVAKAIATSGDIGRAEAVATRIDMPFHRQAALLAIVEAAAPTDIREARVLANLITCADLRAMALAALIKADSDLAGELIGQFEPLADMAGQPRRQMSILIALADATAAAGDVDRAEDLVRQIDPAACSLADEDRLITAIGQVAARHVLGGRYERAGDLMASLPNPRNEDRARAAAAREVAAAGLVDQARVIAVDIHNARTRRWALRDIPSVAAAAGHVDAAEPVARALTDRWQADAMIALARTVARLGDLDRAERLARSASDRSEDVVTALLGIAEFAPGRVRRLLATTLRLGHWSRSVRELTRMDPALVAAVTEEYLGLLDGHNPSASAHRIG
ncbi:hypothetical protein [Kutzneria buriramensis]|uniref:hypothetical protein n=1 Tax=Kutzneria buriramensis TaxID=1045776 RepID=UPI0011C1CA84|nr:hypothetical protein [Kutzneria buriramensis]